MGRLVITYTLDINPGDLTDEAVAEYLLRAERDESENNLWEMAQHTSDGTPQLVNIVAEK